jgi:hypothetical protein
MNIAALFLTHQAARDSGKSPFFFSRFNFQNMKTRGNTHYCFACGGDVGFTPGIGGVATNSISRSGYDPMKQHHTQDHADAIVGDADKYETPSTWLQTKVPPDFPYIIAIR